jgi:hypothetical protein
MRHKLNGCRNGRQCSCGAQAADGGGTCEKCRFRARWLRRKMPRNPGIG